MDEFWLFRERKAARARAEIRAFWERRGTVTVAKDPLSLFAESVAPPAKDTHEGSSRSLDDWSAEREYLKFVATGPSDEELLEWVLRAEV